MIHPSQLTKEAGFEEGVVVEINGRPWIYDGFYAYSDNFLPAVWTKNGGPVFLPRDITSIRPLTGDMAIWNFAPEWAEWLVNWGDSIQWGVNEDNAGSGIMIKRPWWAK